MMLKQLGWDATFEAAFQPHKSEGLLPARVVREDRGQYALLCDAGPLDGEVSGRFRHEASSKGDFPAVGDWVACEPRPEGNTATIHAVLPRRSAFIRKVAGSRTDDQVVASNIDTVFIVSGLDGGRNFNPRRLERYLALAWESGAEPVLVLNKRDLCDDPAAFVQRAESIGHNVPVHVTSAVTGDGTDALRAYMGQDRTVAFLGSSGVGKSALVNALLGTDMQDTGSVRGADRRGRHTTTHRELILLNEGGAVIDTPGMRELQLWGDEELAHAFADIDELARDCRFRDCRHEAEPGCAVLQAVTDGGIELSRYEGFQRLRKEQAHLARRKQENSKARTKDIALWARQYKKQSGRG